jgi:hypothetical protein
MKNEYESWLKKNETSGQAWTGKLLPLAAAGMATALVGLSVVMMAGLGLPAGELPLEAKAPAGPAAAQNVRYAQPLPTVTVVGRREATEPGEQAPVRATTAALPVRPASGEAATVGMTSTGDNLRQ